MPDRNHVAIDLKQLSDLAHVGVRRAVLFMGLGLNAAHRDDFNDYELHKLPRIPSQTSPLLDFFPSGLPQNRIDEFKREFAIWITGCGLREVLEHYALFLDHIHKYCLLVYQSRGRLGKRDPLREQKKFNQRLGIPDKLDVLQKSFSVAPGDSYSIAQLYRARNCLTHDFGIVTPKRCDDDGKFILSWRAFDLILVGKETGSEQAYSDFIGRKTQEDATMAMKPLDRERTYLVGEKIVLSQQDLAEICHFFASIAIPGTIQSFLNFLERNGVSVDGETSMVPMS